MMSIETAKEIANFLDNNNINRINLMGGEFFLNPDWYEIIKLLSVRKTSVRIVTTGDWIHHSTVCENLIRLKEEFGDILCISVSNDRWHNNKNVKAAEDFLNKNQFLYTIGISKHDREDVLVPIGRSEGDYGFYGLFGCYCHNPKNMYSFLINEKGDIYKCSFGVWNYASVQEYQEGGFAKNLKISIRSFMRYLLHLVNHVLEMLSKLRIWIFVKNKKQVKKRRIHMNLQVSYTRLYDTNGQYEMAYRVSIAFQRRDPIFKQQIYLENQLAYITLNGEQKLGTYDHLENYDGIFQKHGIDEKFMPLVNSAIEACKKNDEMYPGLSDE